MDSAQLISGTAEIGRSPVPLFIGLQAKDWISICISIVALVLSFFGLVAGLFFNYYSSRFNRRLHLATKIDNILTELLGLQIELSVDKAFQKNKDVFTFHLNTKCMDENKFTEEEQILLTSLGRYMQVYDPDSNLTREEMEKLRMSKLAESLYMLKFSKIQSLIREVYFFEVNLSGPYQSGGSGGPLEKIEGPYSLRVNAGEIDEFESRISILTELMSAATDKLEKKIWW